MKSFPLARVTRSGSFRSLAARAGHHAFEPASDDGFRITHDARHQLRAGWDVVDQSLHLACGPDAFIGVAGGIDHLAAGAGHEIADLFEGRAFLLHGDDLGADRIPGDTRGVAHGAENQLGLAFVVGDDLFLDQVMDRTLPGAHEPRAHVDAFGAERERGHQTAAVAKTARGNQRNFHLIGRHRNQDQAGGVVLAGMAAHSKPSIEIASTPMRSADSAWRTLVHLCTTTMPCFLNSLTCSCGLLPAVSTILMPLSLMDRRYSA